MELIRDFQMLIINGQISMKEQDVVKAKVSTLFKPV